jgi:hypothetical protein
LEGFTRKKDHVSTCRCPVCGDSKTNKSKKRFYIFPWKNELKTKCHNCDYSANFGYFLKYFDPFLYEQYKTELFKEKYGTTHTYKQPAEIEAPKSNTEEKLAANKTVESIFYSICIPLSELPDDNPAVQYCVNRKIPKIQFSRLFYIDDTKKLLQIKPDIDIKFSEQRLVLPFFDKLGNLIGMTCRALNKSKLRYLTIKLTDHIQVFGLDKVDPSKKIYAVEGPIDSLFLPNAIAVTGTSFGKIDAILKDLNIASDQVVIVIDNQPRNKEVVKILSRIVDNNFNVVIWDIDDSMGKDINSLVQDAGMSPYEVFQIIKRCVVRGLEAKMKFTQWKKC